MSKKSGLSFLWLSAIAFVVDLLTKYIVVQKFDLYESVNVLPVFNLTYVRNYGAAFSFLADHDGWQKYFFILLAIGISLMLAYFMKNRVVEFVRAVAGFTPLLVTRLRLACAVSVAVAVAFEFARDGGLAAHQRGGNSGDAPALSSLNHDVFPLGWCKMAIDAHL